MKIISACYATVRGVSAAAAGIFLLCLANSLAQAANFGSCSIDSPTWAPNPSKIAAGSSSKVTVYFTCYSDTAGLNDTITVQIPGLPKGATWQPKTITTTGGYSGNQTIIISTTKKTKLGTYQVAVGGRGKLCTSIVPPCGAPDNGNWHLTIANVSPAPSIVCAESSLVCTYESQHGLWWFNGLTPQPDNYHTILQAHAAEGTKQYTWELSDTSYAQFSNNSGEITTSEDTVEVLPNGDPGDEARSVTITVSDGEQTSNPFLLTVRKAYKIEPSGAHYETDAANSLYGYRSTIAFNVLDQYGERLPAPVPVNADLDVCGSGTCSYADYSGTNWNPVGAMSIGYPSTHLEITLEGAAHPPHILPVPVPLPQKPCKPARCEDKIVHTCGYIEAGSSDYERGVQLATVALQKFRDHGRACDLASPAASDLPGQSLPACPGKNATECPP